MPRKAVTPRSRARKPAAAVPTRARRRVAPAGPPKPRRRGLAGFNQPTGPIRLPGAMRLGTPRMPSGQQARSGFDQFRSSLAQFLRMLGGWR